MPKKVKEVPIRLGNFSEPTPDAALWREETDEIPGPENIPLAFAGIAIDPKAIFA